MPSRFANPATLIPPSLRSTVSTRTSPGWGGLCTRATMVSINIEQLRQSVSGFALKRSFHQIIQTHSPRCGGFGRALVQGRGDSNNELA